MHTLWHWLHPLHSSFLPGTVHTYCLLWLQWLPSMCLLDMMSGWSCLMMHNKCQLDMLWRCGIQQHSMSLLHKTLFLMLSKSPQHKCSQQDKSSTHCSLSHQSWSSMYQPHKLSLLSWRWWGSSIQQDK